MAVKLLGHDIEEHRREEHYKEEHYTKTHHTKEKQYTKRHHNKRSKHHPKHYPGWGECSRHCTEDRTTVCLYGENVPLCYANCKKKVRILSTTLQILTTRKYLLYGCFLVPQGRP